VTAVAIELLAAGGLLLAQQTVAPSTEPVARPRGEDRNGYNVQHSFETGYRFRGVGGNVPQYQSDVNFSSGARLLSSSLAVHSKEGQGRLFDQISLETQGLGNDPYQAASVRLEKNRFYRYDMVWRLQDYVNPAFAISGGAHAFATVRRSQDHDFTLFPQSGFRLFAGLSRNRQAGPALNTVQLFDSRGDEFPPAGNVRRAQNDYRLGLEVRLLGMKFTALRTWEKFTEEWPLELGPSTGFNRDDESTLGSFRRAEPYEGSTPGWRFHLFGERGRWFAANARFAYSAGRRNFRFEEAAVGTDRFGRGRNRQIVAAGNGRRPVSSGAVSLNLFPSPRLTVVNHSALHHVRMEGDNSYAEINNATAGLALLQFRFLGLRSIVNTSDANYRPLKWLGLYSGYHYSTRRIRSREQLGAGPSAELIAAGQDNRIHAGLAGIRMQPADRLSIHVDAEVGRASRPFFPISERDYHTLGVRAQYKTKTVLMAASTRAANNTNSVSLSAHGARSRVYAVDASWTASTRFAIDSAYSKTHLDTLSGIAYFAAGRQIATDQSLYVSNVHAGHLGARVGLGKRADLYAGYSRVEDAGDGRNALAVPPPGRRPGSALPLFRIAQTFPLAYESPLARFSLLVRAKLRWNIGYQFYRYREDFLPSQNYRAHTGFTSVVWSF